MKKKQKFLVVIVDQKTLGNYPHRVAFILKKKIV